MTKERVLVIDRQEAVHQLLSGKLAESDREVICQTLPGDIPEMVKSTDPNLLILDPAGSPEPLPAIIAKLRQGRPDLPIIIISSEPDIEQAVAAIKAGAVDYLSKPLPLSSLLETVTIYLQQSGLDRQLSDRRRRFRLGDDLDYYKSTSGSMVKVYDDAMMVAMSLNTSALITGASGTGKEVIAQLIHQLSPRHSKAFMEVNCAAIPSELLESELFGHEAGAFTDAKESKPGLFELADKGSIFLDEIGEMTMNLQVKLLRFLERKTFRRVGGTHDITVDVRIVSATNRDLREMVKEKLFREDLYYRLNVIPIKIPPLRDRREDILPLIGHFFKHFNPRFNKNFTRIGEDARRMLMEYPWPGNIRELRNIVERVLLMETGPELTAEQLQPFLDGAWNISPESFNQRLIRILEEPIPEEGLSLEEIINGVERCLIEKAYTQANRNQSQAAEMLRLGRDKMRYRMKQFAEEEEHSS